MDNNGFKRGIGAGLEEGLIFNVKPRKEQESSSALFFGCDCVRLGHPPPSFCFSHEFSHKSLNDALGMWAPLIPACAATDSNNRGSFHPTVFKRRMMQESLTPAGNTVNRRDVGTACFGRGKKQNG